MKRYVEVSTEELQKLRDVVTESRALLRALRTESQPHAHLAESVITQHHMNRLAELVEP